MAIFVLHSVQTLQLTANEVSANALLLLVDRLDTIVFNGTSSTAASNITLPALFAGPTRSSVRLSILWFISFILSLSTLAIGVVILQWITEHQRYTNDISTKEMVAMYRMRAESLRKWYVPQIISGLPLLLLFAVVFFFSGIIVYLFAINRTLAIIITVFIAITLFFLLITTFLPTLQCFILTFREPSRKKDVPSQCPYKSPQSWMIYHSVAWIFKYSFSWGRNVPLALFLQRHHKNWANFDSWWIRVRNTYSQFIHGVFDLSSIDPKAPGFDESEIIVHTMQNYSETSKAVLAAYYCFQDVSRTALALDSTNDLQDLNCPLRKRNQLLHMLYWNSDVYGKITAASNQIDTSSDVHKMHDENLMLFFWLPGSRTYPDPIARGIANHLLELQSRKLGYTLLQGSLEDTHQVDDREMHWLSRIYKQYKSSTTDRRFDLSWTIALHRRVSKDVIKGECWNSDCPKGGKIDCFHPVSVEQYVLILESFFRKYATELGQAWTLADLQTNVHGRAIIQNFLAVAVYFKSYLFEQSTSSYTVRFRTTLSFIASVLQSSWNRTETHERHDFLFFAITYFLVQMFQADAPFPVGDDGIPLDLLKGLSVYEMTVDKDAWVSVFSGSYVIGNWTSQLQAYENRTSELQVQRLQARTPTQDMIKAQAETALKLGDHLLVKDEQKKPGAANGEAPGLKPNRHFVRMSEDTAVGSIQGGQAASTSSQDIYQPHGRQELQEESNSNARIIEDSQSMDTEILDNDANDRNPTWEIQEFQARGQTNDGQAVFTAQGQSGQMQRTDESQGFRSQETLDFEQRQMKINSQNNQYNSQVTRNNEWGVSQSYQDNNNQQIDSQNDRSFLTSSTSIQNFELMEEERRRVEFQNYQWQQTQRFSETSAMYDTTTTSQAFDTSHITRFDSYNSLRSQQNHFSWASDTSSPAVHEQVEDNLFY